MQKNKFKQRRETMTTTSHALAFTCGLAGHENANPNHMSTPKIDWESLPLNSSAALPLTHEPPEVQVKSLTLMPRMLYNIREIEGKRGRGRPSKRERTNTAKFLFRIEGLDGYERKTRVFDNKTERNTFRKQARRQKKKPNNKLANENVREY